MGRGETDKGDVVGYNVYARLSGLRSGIGAARSLRSTGGTTNNEVAGYRGYSGGTNFLGRSTAQSLKLSPAIDPHSHRILPPRSWCSLARTLCAHGVGGTGQTGGEWKHERWREELRKDDERL